jgi:uncharacterized protein (TIGR03382 family)
MFVRFRSIDGLMILGLAGPGAAWANGQTSHQWITLAAIEKLPPGELRELLERAEVHDALLSGTMFPDGGYAVDHGYGEAAHWEPFQDRYLAWIRERCAPQFAGNCAQHVAFLMGLRSHGLADQVYDAVYMERSKQVDIEGWASGASMDEATDVAFAHAVSPGMVPQTFLPLDPLLGLFAEHGEPVDAATVEQGQRLLGLAIQYVGLAGQNADGVQRYEAQFPWACAHQDDPTVAGTPQHEAEAVAAYWQVTWGRLVGDDDPEPALMFAYPSLDTGLGRDPAGMVLAADDVRSRVQLIFSRGLDPASVTPDRIRVLRDGVPVPLELNVFYGRASHVVNVQPVHDWEVATYEMAIEPGISTFDGRTASGGSGFSWFTGPWPTVGEEPRGCGCGHGVPGTGWAVVAVWALQRRKRRWK